MNVLRYIKGTSWGASKLPMVSFCIALLRSVTDYTRKVYFNPNTRKQIELIQNQVLRLCTGVMKSIPIICL